MLSQNIDNAAKSISNEIAKAKEGGKISVIFMRGLQSNLRAMAEQARQHEAQIAPGATLAGRTVPVMEARRA